MTNFTFILICFYINLFKYFIVIQQFISLNKIIKGNNIKGNLITMEPPFAGTNAMSRLLVSRAKYFNGPRTSLLKGTAFFDISTKIKTILVS